MLKTLSRLLTFTLRDLSTYRSELMGWSILWIMALHFRFITLKPLGFIAQYGFSGVEIFMFVSGLGLYYSLQKDARLPIFYRKRVLRIFPTYYFIGIFASLLLFSDNLTTYLFRYSTIGFWTGLPYFEWYIPSIVALYLAAPFLKRWLDSRWSSLLAVAMLLVMLSSYYAAKHQTLLLAHFFLYYRIPAFVAGMYCAKMLVNGKLSDTLVGRGYMVTALTGIVAFVLCYPLHHSIYEFKYYSLFFLMPVFIWFFCLLSRLSGRISSVIRIIGNASLEIYLIQSMFFSAIVSGQLVISDSVHDIITFTLIISCSLAGIALHHLIDKAMRAATHESKSR